MEMKKYIDIVEAFGQDEEGEMDKRLLKAYPKTFREKLNVPLTAAVWLASAYGGVKLGISWLDAKEFGEKIFAGGLGSLVGAVLGTVPAAITSATLNSNKARSKAKEDEINDFIVKNPNIKSDLENFVKMLVAQTPRSILKDVKYLDYLNLDMDDRDERIQLAVQNLASLISNYFDQQDEKWQKLARKYQIDSPTLYQIRQHIGGPSIDYTWKEGVKRMVSAPTNEKPIEEASDEAIARIVELSKDKK